MDTGYALAAIAGLGVVTLVTRGLFLFPDKPVPIPAWLERGLKVAPLAALSAVVVPEIVALEHGGDELDHRLGHLGRVVGRQPGRSPQRSHRHRCSSSSSRDHLSDRAIRRCLDSPMWRQVGESSRRCVEQQFTRFSL